MPRLSLTDRFAAGVKATGQERVDYFDEKSPGLALRVSPGGNKAWTYHFTSPKDRKRARVTLGSYPATSLAAARTRAMEARQLVEGDRDPRDVFADQAAGAMTVADLVASYIEKHVRPNLRTAPETERRFKRNIVPVIGGVRLSDLHRRDINRVVDPIMARDSPTEGAHAFEDMRAMLRWGLARGDIDRNPTEGMRKPATAGSRERVLTDDEIRLLWTELPMLFAKSKATQRIVKLCLVTLQRVGEVSGMRRAELDLSARVWSIPGSRTKNGHPHTVPLSDLAVVIIKEALEGLDGEQDFVFPNIEGDGSLPARSVAKNIAAAQRIKPGKIEKRSALAHWTSHDLRRTGATNMGRLAIAPIVIGHVINHRSTTKAGVTLGVYQLYDYGTEKRQALEKWSERLNGLVSNQVAEVVWFGRTAT
jgi:integrase